MTLLTDSSVLLHHIKNSFIYGDETGICELIVEREMPKDYDFHKGLRKPFISEYAASKTGRKSPEIRYDDNSDLARKSSAILRIKEVEQQRKLISPDHVYIDTGLWPRQLNADEINEYFSTEIKVKPIKQGQSKLAQMLQQVDNNSSTTGNSISNNAFVKYARNSSIRYSHGESKCWKCLDQPEFGIDLKELSNFDLDSMYELRDYSIYFWDLEAQRHMNYPVVVRPIRDTTVEQMIGLVCWKYTEEMRQPSLLERVNLGQTEALNSVANVIEQYNLYMFEDEDDLSMDFGCLLRTDPIYKYQFDKLALLNRSSNGSNKGKSKKSVHYNQRYSTHSHNTSTQATHNNQPLEDADEDEDSFVTRSHLEKMGLASQQNHINTQDNYRADYNPYDPRMSQLSSHNEDEEEEEEEEEVEGYDSDCDTERVVVEIGMAQGSSKLRLSREATVGEIINMMIHRRNLQHSDKCQYFLHQVTNDTNANEQDVSGLTNITTDGLTKECALSSNLTVAHLLLSQQLQTMDVTRMDASAASLKLYLVRDQSRPSLALDTIPGGNLSNCSCADSMVSSTLSSSLLPQLQQQQYSDQQIIHSDYSMASNTPSVNTSTAAFITLPDLLQTARHYHVQLKQTLRKIDCRLTVSVQGVYIEPITDSMDTSCPSLLPATGSSTNSNKNRQSFGNSNSSEKYPRKSKKKLLLPQIINWRPIKSIYIPLAALADCIIGNKTYNNPLITKTTVKFVHLKSKFYATLTEMDKDTKSSVSSTCQHVVPVLSLEQLTNHSVSCGITVARQLVDHVTSLMELMELPLRQNYLNSTNNNASVDGTSGANPSCSSSVGGCNSSNQISLC